VKPPIFVWEPNDLMAFKSPELAEQFIEELEDVEGCDVFDSEGRRLQFEVARKVREWPGYVLALSESPDPPDPAALRQALTRALEVSEAAEEMPLAELVEQAAEKFETRNPSGADLLRALVPGFLRRKRN
jgi:hypothetical protein